mmetsp:Transcript_39072/g.118025  ORF Transcript_39072/g.118025 Transcript_39072/m.118025 type:complete len:277 (+) Transcript_39072:206-1036(+)
MHVEVEVPGHFSHRHVLRQLLQLQGLVIDELAQVVHDNERVGWALLQPRAAIASTRDVRGAITVGNDDFLCVFAIRALQHDLPGLVPGLFHGGHNALHDDKLLHLLVRQLTDQPRFHHAKAALEVYIACELQLDDRALLEQALFFVFRDEFPVQLLENTLAQWNVLRGARLQSVGDRLPVLVGNQIAEVQLQVKVPAAAILLQLLPVLQCSDVDPGHGRVISILFHEFLEFAGDRARLDLEAFRTDARGVGLLGALDDSDRAVLLEHARARHPGAL